MAEKAGAYVLYPEQSLRNNPQRCWNWFIERNQLRDGPEPAAILGLVEETCARNPIDRSRIFVAGLSAGGAMAAILAEQEPALFSAVGIMAGIPLHASSDLAGAYAAMHGDVGPGDITPLLARHQRPAPDYAKLRVMLWTGDDDAVVAPRNSGTLARQFLHLLGVDEVNESRERRPEARVTRWRDGSGRVRVELWCIAAMGHAWSGGSLRGSFTFPPGPRASEIMMSFFLGDVEERSDARGASESEG